MPWASSQVSWLMRDVQAKLGQVVMNDVANKPILPLNVDEVVRVTSKCTVLPFGHKALRQHLSGARWVHHDKHQGALCPRV